VSAYVQLDSPTLLSYLPSLAYFASTLLEHTYMYIRPNLPAAKGLIERRDRSPMQPFSSHQATSLKKVNEKHVPSSIKNILTVATTAATAISATVNPQGNFAVLSRLTRQVVRGTPRGILPSSSRFPGRSLFVEFNLAEP